MRKRPLILFLLVAAALPAGCRGKKPNARPIVRNLTPSANETAIVFEAEDFTGRLEPPMTLAEDSSASGGKCIRIAGGSGKPGGKIPGEERTYPDRYGAAVFKFTVTAAGKYRLWGRRFWEDGCGNSFTMVVNGRRATFTGPTYDSWQWQACAVMFDLPAGENTLEVLNREDGVKLDKIILTADFDFIPQGKEEE